MNSIMIIKPYFDGTWVFDDESVGLIKQPFVCGVPVLIDYLVQDIPDAKDGFNMYFSGQEFPGYQAMCVRKVESGSECGGTTYSIQIEDKESGVFELEGWLCPALFKYFDEAPEKLYVKAEAQNVPTL